MLVKLATNRNLLTCSAVGITLLCGGTLSAQEKAKVETPAEKGAVAAQAQANEAKPATEKKAANAIDPRVKRAAAQAMLAKKVAAAPKEDVDDKAPELAQALFGAAAAAAKQEVAFEVGGAMVEVNDNFDQQFRPQFEPLMKAELYYVRSLCKPDNAQYQVLKKAAQGALDDAVKKYSASQRKAQQGLRIVNGQPSVTFPDPQKIIADGMLAAVRANLPEASVAIYVAESEKRSAQRKQAAVRIMVSKLDRDVILSAEQRTQITESLTQNFDEQWSAALERFTYGDDYIPRPPNNRVEQFLNANQKAAWSASANPNQGFFWGWAGGNIRLGAPLDPDALTE